MTAAEVRQLIEAELDNDWISTHWHGVDFNLCLCDPVKKICVVGGSEELIELWLVFDSSPQTKSGYIIVYDDTDDTFGLACHSDPYNVFIGFYGSFKDTLIGM